MAETVHLQVDPNELIKTLYGVPPHHRGVHTNQAISHPTAHSSRYASATELSKYKIPHHGAPADAVHQLLKDELDLAGGQT